MHLTAAIILSYLLGSFPTAYLFGKWYKGIDIRQHGSGNVGATNTFRVLGKGPGFCVLAVDILKGTAALLVVGPLLGVQSAAGMVLLGVAVVCGHNWTVFLNFKGGKGIATSLGVLIGMTVGFPSLIVVLVLAVAVWAAVLFVWKYISLASVVSAALLPILMIVFDQPAELVAMGAVFCVFVIYRHRSNISRIRQGTEPRVPLPFSKNTSRD